MKKFKIFSLLLCVGLVFSIFTSCEDITQFDIANGGEWVGVNITPPTNISYKRGVDTSVNIPYNAVETQSATLASITVYKQLIIAGVGSSDVVSYPNQTGEAFTQTTAELYADVPVDGTTYSDDAMKVGDIWRFNFDMILSDGRVLKGSTSYAETDVEFTCPSDLAGDYPTNTVWTDYYGVDDTNNWTETFTKVGDDQYTITDLSGGMEPIVWNNPAVEVTIKEVCGVITLVSNYDLYDYFIDEGTVNGDGSITIVWRNEFDEFGTNTYTPN